MPAKAAGGTVVPGGDELDHAVAFLKTRDGLDKALKLMRYASMIGSLHALRLDPRSVAGEKLRRLEGSTALTRKFLRLGKFLGNAQQLRALARAHASLASPPSGTVARSVARIEGAAPARAALRLNRLAIGCQGAQLAYYFVEQFTFASKVGLARGARFRSRVATLANWSEMLIYVFSLQLAWIALRDAEAKHDAAEAALRAHVDRHGSAFERAKEDRKSAGDGGGGGDVEASDDDDSLEEDGETTKPFAPPRDLAAAEDLSGAGRRSLTSSPLKHARAFLARISKFEAPPEIREATLREALATAANARRVARWVAAAEAADALACLGECRGGENALRTPGVVAALGLVSAVGGVVEKWAGVKY